MKSAWVGEWAVLEDRQCWEVIAMEKPLAVPLRRPWAEITVVFLPSLSPITEPSLDTTLETRESKSLARLLPSAGGVRGEEDHIKMSIVRGRGRAVLFEANLYTVTYPHIHPDLQKDTQLFPPSPSALSFAGCAESKIQLLML